jgi:hypothetical protein
MAEIPESLLRRSAEAKAKALGLPVEQVLAEMRGEKPPASAPEPTSAAGPEPVAAETPLQEDEPAPPAVEAPAVEPGPTTDDAEEEGTPAEKELVPVGAAAAPMESGEASAPVAPTASPPAPPPPAPPAGNGGGNGKKAAVVTARPVTPPTGVPEGVRTQRLLTVVKARAIQQVKTEPTDKVNTWPHLMLAEFAALLAVTGALLILSVILQAPLLDPANFNATPNPSKAPWYFLGLQELLSYFDPQIAGVTVPTVVGLVGFMAIPYVDRNPSTKPSDRKLAIMLYTFFMAGAATLTMFCVLFRGLGFNFSYPWRDGIFFDDIKDWVFFE